MVDLVDWAVGVKDCRTTPRVENSVNSTFLHPYPSCRHNARNGDVSTEIPTISSEFFTPLSYNDCGITIWIIRADIESE